MNPLLMSLRWRFCTALLLVLGISGCATSPPSHFYVLSAPNPPESSAPVSDRSVLVAIGPVTIPDYINRPEIVTTDGPNEVTVHEFHRWVGSLDHNIARVIVENLSTTLPAGRFNVVRWNPAIAENIYAVNRVMVEVTRFDVSAGPGGAAIFEAEWVLYGSQSKVLAINKSSRKVPVKGADFKDMTAAMSQCLTEFSGEVASAINTVNTKAVR
jgi:uncharacterized protein